MTLLIKDKVLQELIPLKSAIPVIEEAFRMAGERETENPPRFRMPSRNGRGVRFGMAALHGKQVTGFKIRADFGAPIKKTLNVLYSTKTGELLAIIDGPALGKLRTAAMTGVVAKHLSPTTASTVGIYGAGKQAGAQLAAICEVRPIKAAHVYSRTADRRDAFCLKMAAQLAIDVIPAAVPEDVPRSADIIVTMTNSATPVLLGKWITRACLVIGIGANERFEREIDEHIVRMAKLIVTDDKEAARMEESGGDLMWPIAHGLLRWEQVHDLGNVIAGRVPMPDFASGIILFESHGIPLEDVAISAYAHELARERGLGTAIDL